MRLIAVTLFCLNVIVALWYVLQRSQQEESSAVTHFVRLPSVPTIELVGAASETFPDLKVSEGVVVGHAENRRMAASDLGCYRVANIQSGPLAEALMADIADRGWRSELNVADMELARKYWVMVPPLDSRAVALKVLRELQTKKIDSFIITDGEYVNGISLGVFSSEDAAQRMIAEREKQGVTAHWRLALRMGKVYSLRVNSVPSGVDVRGVVGRVLGDEFQEKNLEHIACERVATENVSE